MPDPSNPQESNPPTEPIPPDKGSSSFPAKAAPLKSQSRASESNPPDNRLPPEK